MKKLSENQLNNIQKKLQAVVDTMNDLGLSGYVNNGCIDIHYTDQPTHTGHGEPHPEVILRTVQASNFDGGDW